MAKALGAEIMEFYDHHWPQGYYHDDSQIEFHDQNPPPEATDDIWILEPETKYDLEQCGVLISEKDGEAIDFALAFNRWKRTRDVAILAVHVPKAREQEIRDYLKLQGCKVQ